MRIKTSPKEVWYWYQKIEEWKVSEMKQKHYCVSNGIDYLRFWNMYLKIEHKRISNPKEYSRLVALAKQYLASDIKMKTFVADHNVAEKTFVQTITHLSYLKMIEAIKEGRIDIEDSPMQFVQVPAIQSRPSWAYQAPVEEVLSKQNDLEIIIDKGVRVIISPNIDAMKVVKIIELLKDL